MMGGALGLAVLASVAAHRTTTLLADGEDHLNALVGGYHVAFVIGAVFAIAAATIGASLLRVRGLAGAAHAEAPPSAEPAIATGSQR